MHTLGIDVGGTKIAAILYDSDMNPVQTETVPTNSDHGPEAVLASGLQLLGRFSADTIQRIGIAWPGFVTKSGKIEKTPNIPGFEGRYLAKELQDFLGITCTIENDARLFALAESEQNLEAKATLGIICGTGCGGGFVMNGVLQTGAHGYAGEIGHVLVGDREAEDLFSGTALHDLMVEQGWGEDIHALQKSMEEQKENYREAMKPRIDQMAFFLRNFVMAYDVDDIVFGGSAGVHFWSLWFPEIQERLDSWLEKYPNKALLRASALDNAGCFGAALLANRSAESETNLK